MNKIEKHVSFITPAFLTGGNQNQAELRPASVRGELRWWFRVLGGSREAEASVFGAVQPEARASKVVVRIANVKPKHAMYQKGGPNTAMGYLDFFATVSGNKDGIHRTEGNAYFSEGTSFTIEVLERRPLTDSERALLSLSLDCLVRLGALGLRSTRTFGAMAEEPLQTEAAFVEWTKTLDPKVLLVRKTSSSRYGSAQEAQRALGNFLKTFRKEERISGKSDESALGYSIGQDRQASALHLRPVQVKEGFLPVIVYTDAACSAPSVWTKVSDATDRID